MESHLLININSCEEKGFWTLIVQQNHIKKAFIRNVTLKVKKNIKQTSLFWIFFRLFTQYILLFVHCQSYQIPPTHTHCHFIQLGIELSHCSVSKLKSNRSSYCGTFNSNTYIGILFQHSIHYSYIHIIRACTGVAEVVANWSCHLL